MTKSDKIVIAAGLLSAIFLLIMINLTTPSDVGPLGVLVFFTLAYIVCLSAMIGVCRISFAIRNKFLGRVEVSRKRSYYYGSILAFAPILLIFMRSFGELNYLEIALVMIFVTVGCFYISKRA